MSVCWYRVPSASIICARRHARHFVSDSGAAFTLAEFTMFLNGSSGGALTVSPSPAANWQVEMLGQATAGVLQGLLESLASQACQDGTQAAGSNSGKATEMSGWGEGHPNPCHHGSRRPSKTNGNVF